jgi:hypothetical protein
VDALGRTVKVTNHLGEGVKYECDAFNQPTKMIAKMCLEKLNQQSLRVAQDPERQRLNQSLTIAGRIEVSDTEALQGIRSTCQVALRLPKEHREVDGLLGRTVIGFLMLVIRASVAAHKHKTGPIERMTVATILQKTERRFSQRL